MGSKQDRHDVPHLIVKKDGADKVEHMHVVTAARRAMAVVVMVMTFLFSLLVITKRGDVHPEDAPQKGCKLLCQIKLAQIAKVVLADEARGTVAHRVGVRIPHREEVLVVSRAACEACREGERDRRPGVNADRGWEDGVECVEVSDVPSSWEIGTEMGGSGRWLVLVVRWRKRWRCDVRGRRGTGLTRFAALPSALSRACEIPLCAPLAPRARATLCRGRRGLRGCAMVREVSDVV